MRRALDKLTRRETECLEFCRRFIEQNGMSPKLSEIADAMSGISRGNVHHFLTSLERRGLIIRTKGAHRSIVIAESNSSAALRSADDAPGGGHRPQPVQAAGSKPIVPVN